MLLDEYERWTADAATVDALLPAAEAALGWLDRHADRDGDGLDEVVLEGLQVGAARATLRFVRGPKGAFPEVVDVRGGPLAVRIDV